MKFPKKRILALSLAALSLCGAGISAGMSAWMCHSLWSQQAAERWQGESDLAFAQVSVFCTEQANLLAASVQGIHESVDAALTTASLQAQGDGKLWYDCYSAACGTSSVKGAKKNAVTAQVTAVGGDFFTMHPLPLLYGCYFSPADLMHDRVVIDELLAWNTFGATNVAGMELTVEGTVYQIAGVVASEKDPASKAAYGETPRLYMPFEAHTAVNAAADPFAYEYADDTAPASSAAEDTAITCYEAVLPNPVRGFAQKTLQDALGERDGMEILQNTGRTSLPNRWQHLRHLREMVISEGISYPYWENAARMVDFSAAFRLLVTILFLIYPVLLGIWYLWKGYRALEHFIAAKREAHKRRYRTIEKDPYSV